MGNYCKTCRFDHRQATGANACPVTTLYWDFLDRNRSVFEDNHRMVFQIKNLDNKRDYPELMDGIRATARSLRERIKRQERI